MVVDVVLTLNVVACMLHHAAKRIAKCSPAAVTNMHGTHRVCRNKLNLCLLTATDVGASKVHALSASLTKDSVFSCCREVEVDEARTSNLNLLDSSSRLKVRHNGLGNLARSTVGKLGRLHSQR